jgi:hypothetical protein
MYNEPTQLLTEINVIEEQVNNKDQAFQLLLRFLELGQKRGAFTIPESAKLYQTLSFFAPAAAAPAAEEEN